MLYKAYHDIIYLRNNITAIRIIPFPHTHLSLFVFGKADFIFIGQTYIELLTMTRYDFFSLCLNAFGTEPDYPFGDDGTTAVFRHNSNKKWFALIIKVSRRKFGLDSDEVIDAVNLKLPREMIGSFSASDGVYPAYHMNKLHWVSVILHDADPQTVDFLLNMSYEATRPKMKTPKTESPKQKQNI